MPYCPACSASVPEGATACPTCGSPLITTPSAGDEGAAPARLLDTESLGAELAESLAPRYEILKPLGAGGMGAVFLAREPALRRLVAVKVLAPYLAADPRARTRFEREARAAAALSHPNIVRVYAVGETAAARLPYIIMQYVEGPTLGHWISQHSRVSERDTRRIVGEVAAALAAAHIRDLVHRDVKPSNVLIEADSGRAFVVDFGVSAALSPIDQTSKLTQTGVVVGTPAYMSPEQAAGEQVTAKSDVYSLGLVAYELVTGGLPYSASTAMGWAAAHLRDPATPVGTRRPDLSPDIARLIDRCLAKVPAQRPDARDVARAMMPSLESEIPWPPPGLDWLRGRGRVLARVSLLALAGGLMTMFALAFTPRILQVHAYWLARFSSATAAGQGAVPRVLSSDPGATSQFVWQTTLIVGLTMFATSLVGLVLATAQTARFAVQRRNRGWHWRTLIDVAVDPDGRSGLVLAGSREFASLDQATRHQVLGARRIRTAGELGSGLWVTAVAALWVLALPLGLVSNTVVGSPLSKVVYWIATVPALALLVVSAVAEHREARLSSLITRRPAFAESDADIAAWYEATPGRVAPAPAGRGTRRATLVAGEILLVALTLLFLAALGTGAGAALVAAIATTRLGPQTAQLTAAIVRVDAEDPMGSVRRLLVPYLPSGAAPSDSDTHVGLRRLLRPATAGAAPLPEYDPAPATLRASLQAAFPGRAGFAFVGPPPPGSPGLERPRFDRFRIALSTIDTLRRAMAHQIPRDTVALLRRMGEQARTALFRQLARADHWDLLEAQDGLMSTSAEQRPFPGPTLSRVGEAALANLLGAVGDVASGDLVRARRRLGENAAAGLRLLEASAWEASVFGRGILESLALSPLAELEQLAGNGRESAELRDATRRLALLESLAAQGMDGLAADPADLGQLVSTLKDSRLPAGWRTALMAQAMSGACTNPREILLGASPTRRAAILAAASDMPGVPHAGQLALIATDPWWKKYFEAGGPIGIVFRLGLCLPGT